MLGARAFIFSAVDGFAVRMGFAVVAGFAGVLWVGGIVCGADAFDEV